MAKWVMGSRGPGGTTRLYLFDAGQRCSEILAERHNVEGWDGKWDWGCQGVAALATAMAMLSALGCSPETQRGWCQRFAADWVACAPRSQLRITQDELGAWFATEAAKDLTLLGRKLASSAD